MDFVIANEVKQSIYLDCFMPHNDNHTEKLLFLAKNVTLLLREDSKLNKQAVGLDFWFM